jgi:hypothetical protein
VRQSAVGEDVNTEAEGFGEDTADWEGSVHAVVACSLYELATALYLSLVAVCKFSKIQLPTQNNVYSRYIHMRRAA